MRSHISSHSTRHACSRAPRDALVTWLARSPVPLRVARARRAAQHGVLALVRMSRGALVIGLALIGVLGAIACRGRALDEAASKTAPAPAPPRVAPAKLPPTAEAPPPITPRRVVIISEDGMRPDVLTEDRAPRHVALMKQGATAKFAETIRESDTLPSHASMLSGVSADSHGLWWNSYHAERGYIHVPTIFSAAHAAGLTTAMIVGKPKLRHIAIPAPSITSSDRAICAAAWPSAPPSTSSRASPICCSSTSRIPTSPVTRTAGCRPSISRRSAPATTASRPCSTR